MSLEKIYCRTCYRQKNKINWTLIEINQERGREFLKMVEYLTTLKRGGKEKELKSTMIDPRILDFHPNKLNHDPSMVTFDRLSLTL
jgi:hypothetical protein